MRNVAPLLSLGAALVAASIVSAYVTPATLLPRPERPSDEHGSLTVRVGRASFPREAAGADDVVVSVATAPRRLVSQSMSTDEYLYAILPPERIVGVSESAYERRISNVYDRVRVHRPVVANDIERVLTSAPDLVFTPAEARPEIPGLLRAAGMPVFRMPTMFPTLASIEDHIRLVGYLSGEDARAESEVRRFRSVVERAAARKPVGAPAPRVMGFGGLYTYGSGTLFSDILRVLGAENVAATHGFVGYDRVTDEHIVRWNPDWIVAGADRGRAARVRARLLASPAIAATRAGTRGQVIVFENQIFLPLSPYASGLVEMLAEALYGAGS